MATIEVVVHGGGGDLYEIDEHGGLFTAYAITVNLLLANFRKTIGTARSLEGALLLIRSHSGRDIKSIDI